MRILLIDPPGTTKGLNTGLGYLSAALERTHHVQVLDLNNIMIGWCGDPSPPLSSQNLEMRIVRSLKEFEPQIVGISVKTFTANITESILRLIRKTRPNTVCIVGGPHVTLDGLNFVQTTGADFGMQGEGEYSLPKLCSALEQNGPLEEIEGLFYRKEGEVRLGKSNQVIERLNDLEFPDYKKFSSIIENGGKIPEYPVLTSRGCPHKCSYCSMPGIMGEKWRYRDPINVVTEIRRARETYQSKSFTIVDDNLTLNNKRVEQLCDLLTLQVPGMRWNSQNGIRADRVSAALAKKMKLSGCQYVWIGIESVDEDVFAAIDKGESLDDIRHGIANIREAGIRVGGFFILGLPGSSRERDLKIIDFVKANKIDAFVFNFVPYPGTRAGKWVEQHARILRTAQGALQFGGRGFEPVFDTAEYPNETRIRTFNEIHVRLGYFDRLVDSSLPAWEKVRTIYGIVRPYGAEALLSLFYFALRNIAVTVMRHTLQAIPGFHESRNCVPLS
jgi:anaerobic magnesium-protoporphyrin IX monomethyl ester cyclase